MVTFSVLCFGITLPVCWARIHRVWPVIVLVTGFYCVYAVELYMRQPWFAPVSEFTNREGFGLIVRADSWVNSLKPDRRLLLWFDKTEARQGVFSGLASLYLHGWSMLNDHLPSLSAQDVDRLRGQTVLVMSWNESAFTRAQGELGQHGLAARNVHQGVVSNGPLTIHLILFDVQLASALVDVPRTQEGLRLEKANASVPRWPPFLQAPR
jgi:hypothetical protein